MYDLKESEKPQGISRLVIRSERHTTGLCSYAVQMVVAGDTQTIY